MIGTILRIRYEITSHLSEGPLFQAYSARDRLLARDVTVRTVASPMAQEKPFLEAIEGIVQKMKSLSHPNIESMLSLDDHEGLPFLVSEPSRGSSLQDRIKRFAPFSVPVAISTVISILEGLEAVHAFGIAHGDIGGHTIAITNEGLARLQLPGIWESYSSSRFAGAAVLPQMAPYLAPELSKGGPPSPSGDLYAVGVLIFELLTARQPYQSDTIQGLAHQHATQPAPRLRALNPAIPHVLDSVLTKCLEKSPADRYRRANELLGDLRIIQDGIRFGKTLTWPLSGAQLGSKAMPIAPRMSAIRTDQKPAPSRDTSESVSAGVATGRRQRETVTYHESGAPDVPWWIRIPLILSLFACAGAVGSFVYYNLSQVPHVRVPKVLNLSKSEAVSSLSIAKLKVGRLIQVESETVPRDRVVDQFPKGGDRVKEGSSVTLRMSGGSRYTKVPDLSGHTQDEARSMLSDLGLNLNDEVQVAPSSKVPRGKIIGQAPKPGLVAERNATVRIQVSSGVPDTEVPPPVTPTSPVASIDKAPDALPNPADQEPVRDPQPVPTPKAHLYTVTLKTTGLTARARVRVDMKDDYGTLTIFDEDCDPDQKLVLRHKGYGEQVTIMTYYDDDLKKVTVQKASSRKQ